MKLCYISPHSLQSLLSNCRIFSCAQNMCKLSEIQSTQFIRKELFLFFLYIFTECVEKGGLCVNILCGQIDREGSGSPCEL